MRSGDVFLASVKERAERGVSSSSLEVVCADQRTGAPAAVALPDRRGGLHREGRDQSQGPRSGSAFTRFSPGSAVRHAVDARFPQLSFI